jgi:hypothetical protein
MVKFQKRNEGMETETDGMRPRGMVGVTKKDAWDTLLLLSRY